MTMLLTLKHSLGVSKKMEPISTELSDSQKAYFELIDGFDTNYFINILMVPKKYFGNDGSRKDT